MALFLLGFAASAWPGETALPREQAAPSFAAVVVTQAPVIDGKLDDPCWQQASHMEGFWRTDHDAPELERTEAWLCYTSRAIYVAFRCYDSEPSDIKATQKKRQGNFRDDDWVGLWLDVTNRGSGFYAFRVNPVGTQLDSTPGGTSEKIEWKGDWRAAAAVDQGGWTAEMEIPFVILRYPNGQKTFRFDVERYLARKQDASLWPAGFARTFDPDRCARWTDISTPPVPFRSCVMPYALSVFSKDDEDRELLTAGVDMKGTFPNGVVGMATANPDFRNLEDVVETIDFTFVERYLPEYRPFFQEGGGFFPPSSIFYSRRVEDFDFGLKSFGTMGSNRFGVLDTYSHGGKNHFAWNFEHQFGTTGSVAVFGAAPRVPDEPRNIASGVYAGRDWPFDGGSKYASASWSASRTSGEGGDDQVDLNFGQWRRQGVGWGLHYFSIGPDFNAEDGYVPETGYRFFDARLEESRSYDQGALQSRYLSVHSAIGESEKGRRQKITGNHNWGWRNGLSLSVGAAWGDRDGFPITDYWLAGDWSRNDKYRRGGWGLEWGDELGFPSRYATVSQCFRIGQRWAGEARFEHSRSAEMGDDSIVTPPETMRQFVLTATHDITDERSLSSRLVCRTEGTNFYMAYRQRVRRGTDMLIVFGDPNADKWVSRVAVKAIWCY